MATARQIEANRKNARRSTGPRSDAGKLVSRANAVKHGLRAEVLTVLPNEDPEAFLARVDAWLADFQPANSIEDHLVRHAAHVSWKIDRAQRYEATLLSARVAESGRKVKVDQYYRRRDALRDLLPASCEAERDRISRVDAGRLLGIVLSTADGCREVIKNWRNLRKTVEAGQPLAGEQEFYAVRMLGYGPGIIEAREAVELVVANRVAQYPRDVQTAENWYDGHLPHSYDREVVRSVLAERPADLPRALAQLTRIIDQAIADVEEYLARAEANPPDDAPEVDRAGVLAQFDASMDGDRLRRYQFSLHRELMQTLNTLLKMRKQAEKDGARSPAPNEADLDRAEEQPAEPVLEASPAPNEANSVPNVQVMSVSEAPRAVRPRGVIAPDQARRLLKRAGKGSHRRDRNR